LSTLLLLLLLLLLLMLPLPLLRHRHRSCDLQHFARGMRPWSAYVQSLPPCPGHTGRGTNRRTSTTPSSMGDSHDAVTAPS
jgi:hypothetical protein